MLRFGLVRGIGAHWNIVSNRKHLNLIKPEKQIPGDAAGFLCLIDFPDYKRARLADCLAADGRGRPYLDVSI